ncbi:MAG: hypothetical protein JEZ02_19280 [Desulfatibacillum sp.]|nr:hypothetical protein [Desulfatibacillum sp.]
MEAAERFFKRTGDIFLSRWVFPFWSVWAVFLYMHVILILSCMEWITSLSLVLALFAPVLVFEWWATGHYYRLHQNPGALYSEKKRLVHWLCNITLWVIFYAGFVVYIFLQTRVTPGFKIYMSFFLINNLLMWRSVMGYGWLALAYWLLMYYVLAVQAGRFRLIAAIFLPMAITVVIFAVQWKVGGAGAASDRVILSQPGVTKALDFGEVNQALVRDYPDNLSYLVPKGSGYKTRGKVKASNKVREVFYDENLNALFAFFGGTYYVYGSTTIPAIVKKDLATGKITYLLTEHNVRRVEKTQNSLFVAPWHDNHIYEISKQDLSIIRAIPVGNYVRPMLWEPMALTLDVNGGNLYVTTSMFPHVVSVDLQTNRQVGAVPLYTEGLIGEGGWAWCVSQSPKTRRLYMVVGSVKNREIVEVDPDALQVVRTLSWDVNSMTAMIMDPEDDALYCQSSLWDELTKVRLDTFEIERTYKGERHARCLTMDPKRNVIYELGYCSGKVFPIDLETGERPWEIRVGGRPHGMHLDSRDRLWINSMSGVFCMDLPTIWKDKGYASVPPVLP